MPTDPTPYVHAEPTEDVDLYGNRKAQFARRLQRAMLAREMTQAQLSRLTELGRDSISLYVRGKVFPGANNLKKIADALRCEIEDLSPGITKHTAERTGDAMPFEMRQVSDDPSKVWVSLNQTLPKDKAMEIMRIVYSD